MDASRRTGAYSGPAGPSPAPSRAEDEPPAWESTPRPPTDEETAVLKRLVAEIVLRAG